MKRVELYGQVRRAVYVEGMSRREAARRFGIDPRGREIGRSIGKGKRHRDDLPHKGSLPKRRRSALKTRRIASIVAATEQ